MSNSLRPHGLQHARPPCPSPTPRVYSNSRPLSQWCHPTISSSVIPFYSCLQSFPASGSFQMSQFFASGGQSIGASASASVLPMNIQDWFPLGWKYIHISIWKLSHLFFPYIWIIRFSKTFKWMHNHRTLLVASDRNTLLKLTLKMEYMDSEYSVIQRNAGFIWGKGLTQSVPRGYSFLVSFTFSFLVYQLYLQLDFFLV